ncbi:hypothetical protein [Limnobacter sp.]|uniref:hypothetical protein n=1 Tax=Limnobacter sp. TaxID=2003368 RepID=UPI00351239BD
MSRNASGRHCPIRYRYSPSRIALAREHRCDVLYVVGGLYGNPFALQAIERLAASEQGRVRICFNGDFNWFNTDPEWFARINERVLQHDCVLGNVEAELGQPLDVEDCGCAYPDDVDQGVVDRSNLIHSALKEVAQEHPDMLEVLSEKPFYARYRVGKIRVGVVHGDAESLAGWRFDPKHLAKPEEASWRKQMFAQARVDVFASSHTCTAAFHHEDLGDGALGLVCNNGAAGMPSASGSLDGLFTRISLRPFAHPHLVYKQTNVVNGVVEQVRVQIPQDEWQRHFLQQWPQGSAAYTSYFKRISQGV